MKAFGGRSESPRKNRMSLEVVLGPMWAGKSSTILGTIRRYKAIGWDILVLTSSLDDRYGEHTICSHDRENHPATAVKELMPVLDTETYQKAKLIVLEESQFFPDLLAFVKSAVDRDGKHVVAVGLDGDSERRPFGQMLELIPLCDTVRKITSLCADCGDGTPALFSHRRVQVDSQVAVGASTLYEPLCRKHYNLRKAV
jgi:thymidine kinase